MGGLAASAPRPAGRGARRTLLAAEGSAAPDRRAALSRGGTGRNRRAALQTALTLAARRGIWAKPAP